MRAAILLRSSDHYKAAAFAAGLQRHGFTTEPKWNRHPTPNDALLIWNRNRGFEAITQIYEAAGAKVLIAENGYTRPADGGKFYALALERHNGAGRWFVGDQPRHAIPEEPWRERGDHILVLPQRGIGSHGVAMPSTWARGVQDRLSAITDRPVVLRPHPGHRKNGEPDTLPDQLRGAHCAVTWGSGAGVRALQAGVPVFHEFDDWIAGPAAARLDGQVEDCHTGDRRLAWTRISWAQWALAEVETGEAFDALLNAPRGDLFCPGQQPIPDHRAGHVRGREAAWA